MKDWEYPFPPEITTDPWSLAVLAPEVVAYLNENTTDFLARLAAADLIEEAGFPDHAERYRWMAWSKKCPMFEGTRGHTRLDGWRWWLSAVSRIVVPQPCHYELEGNPYLPPWKDWVIPGKVHRVEPTRQRAEDVLIEMLLNFHTSPFLTWKEIDTP